MKDKFKQFISYNMCKEGDMAWGLWAGLNALCEIDLIRNSAKILTTYPFGAYRGVIKQGTKIYLYPEFANNIAIYDMETGNTRYIPLVEYDHKWNMRQKNIAKFITAYSDGTAIYMLGYSFPVIVKLELETEKLIYIDSCMKEIDSATEPNSWIGYFAEGCLFHEDRVFIPISSMKGILEIDRNSNEASILTVDTEAEGLIGAAYEDDCIWIAGRGRNSYQLIQYKLDTKENRCIDLSWIEREAEYFDYLKTVFHNPILIKDKLYLLPVDLGIKHIYCFDFVAGKCKRIDEGDVCLPASTLGKNTELLGWRTVPVLQEQNQILFATGEDACWHWYDTAKCNGQSFTIVAENQDAEILKLYANKLEFARVNGYTYNEEQVPVEAIFSWTSSYKKTSENNSKEETNGAKIWNFIR